MELPRDLGDGLVLRRASPSNVDSLTALHAEVHGESDGEEQGAFVGDWFRSVASGGHPTFAIADTTVVEHTATGEIVSALSLIRETWAYDGVPFGVGRVEFVSTRPEFRRRGLVRRQMEVAHRWSSERGHPAQAIMGIPTFYRRFGYELALELGGGRSGYPADFPTLPEDESDRFRIRPVVDADLAFITTLDDLTRPGWLVTAIRDEELWRHALTASREARFRAAVRVIESADGAPIGYLAHAGALQGGLLSVHAYELVPGVSWLAATPAVLRYLCATGEALAEGGDAGRLEVVGFALGSDHPVFRAFPRKLSRPSTPYAWYLRVPDLARFLRPITPVLEERLAASVAAGHSGELRLGSYNGGLRLALDDGRLTAETWEGNGPNDGEAWFGSLSFLRLLFGHRSLTELEDAFPDCLVNTEEARVLLDALFPKRPSRVWPLW